ncbi:MotA/TolQ/ExbB proton channel family protein [candidate division KSB1 bacterium]|nr:MotA/TolQ/ExbB proton channel family protein [candidate division KSB1 bacterium]
MDLATIIGIFSGIGLIFTTIYLQGSLSSFIEVGSIFVVVGGTVAATLINYPFREILSVVGVVKNAFKATDQNPKDAIKTITEFAELARREGILALESKIQDVDEPFLKQALQLAIDGTEPDLMRSILGTELSYLQQRHDLGQGIFKSMGTYAPAFGMIGTLIGLVIMLANMEDPSTIGPAMAIALITTFYGAVLANLIFLPISGKLKERSKQEVLIKELVMEGVFSLQSGENPRIIEQKLVSFIPPKFRTEILAAEKP